MSRQFWKPGCDDHSAPAFIIRPDGKYLTMYAEHYDYYNSHYRIYDMSGREIKTLVNQMKTAGDYSVTFDASNLVSGIYIYRLKVGLFEQSHKMLLLK